MGAIEMTPNTTNGRHWVRVRYPIRFWQRIRCLLGFNFVMYARCRHDDWGTWIEWP